MLRIFKIKLFVIATGIILFSTITLGILTTRYVGEKESALEMSLIQSNIRLASQTLDRVEQQILEQDRTLYEFLPAESVEILSQQLSTRDISEWKLIRHLYLMDVKGGIVFPEAHRNTQTRFFRSKILPQLQVEQIPPLSVHHLHAMVDFKTYYLFSFLKFSLPDKSEYMLVLEYNLDKLDEFFGNFFADLEKTYFVCIRDYGNNLIYGMPTPASRKYFVEQRFPATFYLWLFQLSPRNVSEIEQEEKNRHLLNISLVVINLILILSAWFLVYLGRREESKLTRQKEEFIRNVSHELKTPLALIKMFSEILLMGRGKDEKTQQDYLGIIFAETERMTLLINNVLDFANLEKGLQRFYLEPVQLNDVIHQYLEAFDYRIKKEKIQLHVEVAKEIPPILGDGNALALVLLNLLDNAIKYGGDKAKRIDIRVFAAAGRVNLQMKDYGIGMSPSDVQRAFEKFYRSDNIAVRKIRGSGIGLSLVKYVVDAHKGEIQVESLPSEGTTFTISFPSDHAGVR